MRIGIMEGFRMHRSQVEYGLTPDVDRVSLFSRVKDLGFQGIEFGIGLDFRKDPLWTGDGDLHRMMRAAARETGVEAASICLHLLNYKEYSPVGDKVEYRETADRIIRNTIETCACIDASVILVPFFGTAVVKSEEQIERLVDAMRCLSPLAEEKGVCLALETSLKATDVTGIVEAIGSDHVQVYFDTGNAASKDYDLVKEIEKLKRHIAQVHIKDCPSTSMLGEGGIDFEAVVSALQRVGFGGYLMLETPSTDRPVAAAVKNLDYIRRVVKGIQP